MHLRISLTVILLLFVRQLNAQVLSEWQFRMQGSKDWLKAEVPGCVHTDLLKQGLIPEPFADTNERALQWIGDSTWEYTCSFDVSDAVLLQERQELVFEGLDTYASVYLNGNLLFEADNMFRSRRVRVNGKLKPRNTLLVVFHPVEARARQLAARVPYTLPEGLRSYVRKAQYHFGWDWGPRFLTAGLWKPVRLESGKNLQLQQLSIITHSLNDSNAQAVAMVKVHSDRRRKVNLLLRSKEAGVNVIQECTLNKGIQQISIPFTARAIRKWEPNNRGEQALYAFDCLITEDTIGKVSANCGFRTIQLIQEKDSKGRSFGFRVNGKDIFARGANLIPPEVFLSRLDDSDYIRLVQEARDANANMLRVWGGGIYLPEAFYRACDSLGILVWQDFMFACSMVPGDTAFQRNVRLEAIEQIERLRGHPSLALWCGNNENDEGWKNWGWQKQFGYSASDSARIYNDYLQLFEDWLPRLVDSLDATRSYWPSSPKHGWGRKESMQEGDSHYWGVWWGMEPFEKYREKTGRFMSEYGFQSAPDLSIWKNYISSLRLDAPELRHHQKHPRGFETIDHYSARYFRKANNIEEFTYTSQLVQAYGMKIALDAHRRSWPSCRGSLFWQWNDCWPVISWSAVDYSHRKKLFYHVAKKAFAPLWLSLQENEAGLDVFVQNDGPKYRSVTLRLYYLRTDTISSPVVLDERSVKLPADTAITGAIRVSPDLLRRLPKNNVVLVAEAEDNFSFRVVFRDFLLRCLPNELKLQPPELEIKQVGDEIQLKSRNFIYGIYLWDESGKAVFSDNGFHLLPGEERSIKIDKQKLELRWLSWNTIHNSKGEY